MTAVTAVARVPAGLTADRVRLVAVVAPQATAHRAPMLQSRLLVRRRPLQATGPRVRQSSAFAVPRLLPAQLLSLARPKENNDVATCTSQVP